MDYDQTWRGIGPYLFRAVRTYIGPDVMDDGEAESVARLALLEAMSRWDTSRAGKRPFKNYAFQVASCRAKDELRKAWLHRRRAQQTELIPMSPFGNSCDEAQCYTEIDRLADVAYGPSDDAPDGFESWREWMRLCIVPALAPNLRFAAYEVLVRGKEAYLLAEGDVRGAERVEEACRAALRLSKLLLGERYDDHGSVFAVTTGRIA